MLILRHLFCGALDINPTRDVSLKEKRRSTLLINGIIVYYLINVSTLLSEGTCSHFKQKRGITRSVGLMTATALTDFC
jgi:hypothetical protein